LSEPAIICQLASKVLGEFAGDNQLNHKWLDFADDYSRIRDVIAQSISGFEDYNQKIEKDRFFVLPNSARNREFKTDSGRAEFTVHPLTEIPLELDQFLLMTIRSHDQYNTTIYSNNDRYRGVFGSRRVLFINPDDLSKLSVNKRNKFTITSHFKDETRTVKGFTAVPYDIPAGCLASYFPETNPLIAASSRADISKTPTSKSIVVTLTLETD
jgi:anaerobic selenocysteine-containing dehydrogenase